MRVVSKTGVNVANMYELELVCGFLLKQKSHSPNKRRMAFYI